MKINALLGYTASTKGGSSPQLFFFMGDSVFFLLPSKDMKKTPSLTNPKNMEIFHMKWKGATSHFEVIVCDPCLKDGRLKLSACQPYLEPKVCCRAFTWRKWQRQLLKPCYTPRFDATLPNSEFWILGFFCSSNGKAWARGSTGSSVFYFGLWSGCEDLLVEDAWVVGQHISANLEFKFKDMDPMHARDNGRCDFFDCGAGLSPY